MGKPRSAMDARIRARVAIMLLLLASTRPGSAQPCRLRYPSDAGVAWTCRTLQAGESLASVYGERWRDVARFNRIDRRHARPGRTLRHPTELSDVLEFCPMPATWPEAGTTGRLVVVDRSEQFLGTYEWGQRVGCFPVASGRPGFETPAGTFRLTAADRDHRSSRYPIAGTRIPYPMHFGLRFLVTRSGSSFWLHGRDLPGGPASHGCIGLSDEAMQRRYYGVPEQPELDDASRLFAWAIAPLVDTGRFMPLPDGPLMRVVGVTPTISAAPRRRRRRS